MSGATIVVRANFDRKPAGRGETKEPKPRTPGENRKPPCTTPGHGTKPLDGSPDDRHRPGRPVQASSRGGGLSKSEAARRNGTDRARIRNYEQGKKL